MQLRVYLLRPRLAGGVPGRRAREPRARRGAGVGAGAARRAGRRVPLRGGGRRPTARTSSARRGRRRFSRCAGRTRSRPTASSRCSPPPTRSRSAARWRSALAAFRQAFAGGRDLGERDTRADRRRRVRDASGRRGQGRRAARHAAAARRRRAPRRARRACATVPAVGDAAEDGDRDRALPVVKANRAFELKVHRGGRGPALLARPATSTTSRCSRSTPARSRCSGTRRQPRPGASRARCSADLAQLDAEEFLAKLAALGPDQLAVRR